MREEELSRIVRAVASQVAAPTDMTLRLARSLIARVERRAAEMGVNAVIAVANRAGHPVAVVCMDDAYLASYDIALQKSYTSAALRMKTKELKRLSQPNGPLYGIQHTNGGRIVIFGGGVPLDCDGRTVGALGVSGGSEEQDTALGDFGAEAFVDVLREEMSGGRKER